MDLMAMKCNGLCVSQTSATSFQIPATNLDLCSGHSFRLPSEETCRLGTGNSSDHRHWRGVPGFFGDLQSGGLK